MEKNARVRCSENKELAAYLFDKWKELAEKPKGISENIEKILSKAYYNVCNSKTPIQTMKDLSQVKGVGKWILKLMQGFFGTGSGNSEAEDLTKKGMKNNRSRRYMPQKNSVAYALLITLYRGTSNGKEFMHKEELIDAAEASGLSRAPIAPEKGRGKPQFGSSPRDWYSGWSCMKTLITKSLVVKSSRPAKFMLTEEGKEAARECLRRSGMEDSQENSVTIECSDMDRQNTLDMQHSDHDSDTEVISPPTQQKKLMNIPLDFLERFTSMGYSKEQVVSAFTDVSRSHPDKDVSSLWPAVLCHLREGEVYDLQTESQTMRNDFRVTSSTVVSRDSIGLTGNENRSVSASCGNMPSFGSPDTSFSLRACSSSDHAMPKSIGEGPKSTVNSLSLPPLSLGERFGDAYEVILILDDREQFATQGSRSRRIIENIRSQFKIQIDVRRLPVGDGIWIAHHKTLDSEYVLDFIVERKNVDDLRSSIRDNRYKDQKLRLLRCGLKKLIYLVEGDPNSSEAAESIKTACFTTEILEGFNVQRTSGLADTLKKYGYLTQAISQYYKTMVLDDHVQCSGTCPPFDEFIKRCQDIDKMTVSDVFAVQLMQVPQVTEEVALAVLDLYPTLLSLANAYSLLATQGCLVLHRC
ncbi:crossover junction endonuclease MUS81 isoform X2 [Neltuma alba]|uniref:crossover junction endonuclease MUS81 isoform X2 n=1 Tax=Neltuma alba TaxID=207710 RepID=UPI0010A4A9BD|nr:crossover junction endonuclease MUS81 isoform X2 [Prosopis alba]